MLTLYGKALSSRLMLGTAHFPSPAILAEAVGASKASVVTVSLRRESPGGRAGGQFWSLVQGLGTAVLPNTAGCHTARDAVTTAQLAREVFGTDWIKLEVIGNHDTLQPHVFELVEAARILSGDGFSVFPYTTDDLVVAERLLDAGCQVLMPWCAPIGSAQGPRDMAALRTLRSHLPGVPLIVDAGIGRPSHAAAVMELGYDAVLLNTAVAQAEDPVAMAVGFAQAVEAGRQGFGAGLLEPRDMAVPSTPLIGRAVFT